MRLQDIFMLSFRDLGEKRVRTTLTVLMVMIGVASIIALVSQTAGISASIQSSLQALGPTSIILTSARATGFTIADVASISSLPNVSTVTPMVSGQANLVANGQNTSVTIIGVSSAGLENIVGSVNIYQGSLYNDTANPSSLIGYSVAFPTSTGGRQNIAVGSPVTLKMGGRGGSSYTVPIVGILQKYGSSMLLSVDTSVIMSLQAAETILHRSSYSTMLVKASSTSGVSALSTQLTDIYGNNARVLTTQQLTETVTSIIGSISLLLGVIAGISLLVAAVGIMNIMLMSVLERTHEIGIFKALGFKNRDVLAVFLFQALIIGLMGGIVGIAVGSGASYALTFALASASSSSAVTNTSSSTAAGPSGASTFRAGGGGFGGPGGSVSASSTGAGFGASSLSYTPVFNVATIGAALLIAVLVSVIAGLYPAWRASRMEPIDALRQL